MNNLEENIIPQLEQLEIIEIVEQPKVKKSNSKYVMAWQKKNPEKMREYRDKENMKRKEKRRLLRILL